MDNFQRDVKIKRRIKHYLRQHFPELHVRIDLLTDHFDRDKLTVYVLDCTFIPYKFKVIEYYRMILFNLHEDPLNGHWCNFNHPRDFEFYYNKPFKRLIRRLYHDIQELATQLNAQVRQPLFNLEVQIRSRFPEEATQGFYDEHDVSDKRIKKLGD